MFTMTNYCVYMHNYPFINNKGQVMKSLTPNETGSIELDVPILNNKFNNKNDLIFFILLITYMTIFLFLKKNDWQKLFIY